MEETLRTRRVAELIRQETAAIITNSVHDPKVKDVVITSVRVTRDLDLARIFFTTYGDNNPSVIKAGLERSSGFIRKELMKAVSLKKVPRLEFVIDDIGGEATKIDALINLLHKDSDERGN